MSKKLEKHLSDPYTYFVDQIGKKVTLVSINPINKTAILEELICKELDKAEAIKDFFEMRGWKNE